MGITYCTTCIGFAAGWNSVKDTAGAAVERESVEALFGLHLASAHVEAAAPPPEPGCHGCRDLGAYVAEHGEDQVLPGGCAETAGQLLRQHLLGHLLPQVPVPS